MLMQKSINVKMIGAHDQCATSKSVVILSYLSLNLSHSSDLAAAHPCEYLQGRHSHIVLLLHL
jgi:hypothetical protein